MYVEEMMHQESDTILSLLHNPKLIVYICEQPAMELSVKEAIISMSAEGYEKYPGLDMVQVMEKMVIMKYTNRLLAQVYGNLQN
mmetsp:Transcript_34382/g.50350  ORF Transcript_34382/g.50350 Transcript_34382/m.50350 type:complete len:84 (+) Transcript_34382:3061-3312(+)